MTINTRYLKLSGKVEIAEDMELGQDHEMTIQGEIVKEEHKNNQDGSYDIVYTLKVNA